MISLIWAMDKNWLIGKDNVLPWHFKEDLIYFKEKTSNQVVLMGDKTYFSLKGYYKTKPLPYGKIYVASLEDLKLEDATVINNINEFLSTYPKDSNLWVIGGATIYKLSLPFADRLYITHINHEYEGNMYFPRFDLENDFKVISKRHSDILCFAVYERVR